MSTTYGITKSTVLTLNAGVQLTPAALEQRLQGMTEKLRSEVTGKVREAVEQTVTRILVGIDGSLTIEARPGGSSGWTETFIR